MKSLSLFDTLPRIGIIGAGSIGMAIRNELARDGIKAITYDINHHHSQTPRGTEAVTSIDTILNKSDIVIGCTGGDVLRGVALDRVQGDKILVSASSADVEFYAALNLASFTHLNYGTVPVKVHSRLNLSILNGGYPINFDRQREWEPSDDIQITRCLLYVGLMQSLELGHRCTGKLVALDQLLQEDIVKEWRRHKRQTDAVAEHLADTTKFI